MPVTSLKFWSKDVKMLEDFMLVISVKEVYGWLIYDTNFQYFQSYIYMSVIISFVMLPIIFSQSLHVGRMSSTSIPGQHRAFFVISIYFLTELFGESKL